MVLSYLINILSCLLYFQYSSSPVAFEVNQSLTTNFKDYQLAAVSSGGQQSNT